MRRPKRKSNKGNSRKLLLAVWALQVPSRRKSGEEKTGWAKTPKRPKLMESLFVSEPLKAKGDSEDDVNVVDSEEPPVSLQRPLLRFWLFLSP